MPVSDNEYRRSFITRFVCLCVVIISNVSLATFAWWKLATKRKKIAKFLLYPASAYVVLSTMHCIWNLFSRYMITGDDCVWSDVIDEFIIVFARICLFLWFSYRLEKTFEGSAHKVNAFYMKILRVVFPVFFVAMNAAWIPGKVRVVRVSPFGVYCKNNSRRDWAVYTAYIVEFFVNCTMLYLFVSKLHNVYRSEVSVSTKRLRRTAYNNAVLSAVSIVSTWILFMSSIIEGFPVPVIRWFWVLDWAINVWCLFLMFRMVRWNQVQCCKKVFGERVANAEWLKADTELVDLGPDDSEKSAEAETHSRIDF